MTRIAYPMNSQCLSCPDNSARLAGHPCRRGWLLLLACGLLLSAGCQSGFGESWSLAWKNPFKSTKTDEKNAAAPRGKSVAKKDAKSSASFAEEMSRGRNLEKSGKYSEAREVYQRLIVDYPERYEGYHRLAVVADRQKRYREAQSLYEEALRLERNNAELFNDLGYCFFLQGQMDKAERSLLKAVAMAPSNSRYRNNLGMVYGHQGREEEALEQFRRAGSEADAHYNLAFVRAAKSDFEGAKACFHRALAADPTYEPARRALASFRKAEEDPLSRFDNSPVVQNGTYWVPYREDGSTDAKGAQTVSHNVAIGDSPSLTQSNEVVRQMRSTAQSQLRRARVDAASRVQEGYTE